MSRTAIVSAVNMTVSLVAMVLLAAYADKPWHYVALSVLMAFSAVNYFLVEACRDLQRNLIAKYEDELRGRTRAKALLIDLIDEGRLEIEVNGQRVKMSDVEAQDA
jgi:hypothetical protein